MLGIHLRLPKVLLLVTIATIVASAALMTLNHIYISDANLTVATIVTFTASIANDVIGVSKVVIDVAILLLLLLLLMLILLL